MVETRTTCPYCGVGCGVLVATQGEGAQARITGVRGDPEHPANFGRLCTKGSTLHLTAQPLVYAQTRVDAPELRPDRDSPRRPVDWDAALDHAADRFAAIVAEHGPDAVAFYVSGQLLTEDYYVFNKLAKGLIGTNNIDTNSRLCMSSAVSGYKQTLGADAPPACYDDIDHADCLFVAGSNTAYAHPVLFRRIEDARQARPGMKMIVVDPRRTDTAACADLHLAILPGTDVALFHGMLHAMLWEERVDRAWITRHTEGFDALRERVAEFTPRVAARICGIDEVDLLQAARWFAESDATLSMWCQGLNQSAAGTAKNAALINLHLATGQIGRAGAGPLSLTGQPNAMGGREVGGLATIGSAHRELANPAHRAEIAALWGVPDVPATPGATAVELFDGLRAGRIRAVWIACTNPAQSMPDAGAVREALRRAEFVVVQDAYRTPATVTHADLLLPATTWAEKGGTVTNSERRISRVRPALPPWRQARHDWAIAADFARRLERRLAPAFLTPQRPTLFPYDDTARDHAATGSSTGDPSAGRASAGEASASKASMAGAATGISPTREAAAQAAVEAIWNEHRACTIGRDLDIGGLSYALLDAIGPQQWPFVAGAARGRERLYVGGRFATPSGRARFVAAPYVPVAEPVDARHPFALTTGRLRDQWHGMSRTGTVARLFDHAPQPAIELSPDDAARRGWQDGELLRVSSRRGAVWLPLRTSDALRGGQAFIAMHWGPEAVGGVAGGAAPIEGGGVNALTASATDPDSRQPELKHAAVRIERAAPLAEAVAFGWLPDGQALRTCAALRERFAALDYVACVPFGREAVGVSLRLASQAPIGTEALAAIEQAFGVADAPMLRYDDARRRATRRLHLADGRLRFVLLAGDLDSRSWLHDYVVGARPVAALGRALLWPGARPPEGLACRGRTVCTCLDVDETSIRKTILQAPDDSLDACLDRVRGALGCGSNCGSCLPQVRRIVADARRPAQQAGAGDPGRQAA